MIISFKRCHLTGKSHYLIAILFQNEGVERKSAKNKYVNRKTISKWSPAKNWNKIFYTFFYVTT